MIKILRIFIAVWSVLLASASATISITASGVTNGSTYALDGSAYTQDFDSLPASGTFTWANNSTLAGWSAANSTGGLNATGAILDGGVNAADQTLVSIGAAGPERALAYHTKLTSKPTHLGLAFTNNSGQEITSFTLAYSAEQWREATDSRTVAVAVEYRVGAGSADLHSTTGWTNVPGLGYSTMGGSAPASVLLTATNIPVSVPAGTSLWIRWKFTNSYNNTTSSHDILAIDNVAFATNSSSVATAPAISSHPDSQERFVGESVAFTVAATGTAPLAYQWRKNTVNLDPLANPSAASATLSLANLALGDNGGSYDCVVTNTLDSAISNPATLTVTNAPPVAPSITTHPASQTVIAGSNVTFTVAASGTPPPTYQWKFGIDDLSGETGPSLVINNVQATNVGTYTVTVANSVNSVTSSPATLAIGTPPPVSAYSKYNLTGFATLGGGTTGGGVIPESDAAYRKCATPLEFVTAIRDSNKTAGAVKVIEITANLDLGWNEIDAATKALASVPIRGHAAAKLHPTLIASGVSVIDIVAKSGLTIFSANGATLRHITFNIKSTSNIIIRNLRFDEMWEWDEATKGDYDSNDWDFMVLSNGGVAQDIWIDHCTFTKAYDGIADMKKGTQNITLSWCKYTGDDGATNPNSHVRVQIAALEANKASYPFYNFLRTNGFSQEDIVQVIQGHDKGHLMGATEKAAENNVLSATFHHQWFLNVWDRCVPRLRGGQVHNYNILVDNSTALVARRMRDARASAMSSTARNTLNSTYNFNPFLNGSISTEGGAILVEKSIYQDCITPLRNNQTDVNDPTYTGKIKSTDTIYIMHNSNGTTTTVRGDSTDAGSPMGPFQAAAIPFSWNTADGGRPYPAPPMDDPSDLPAILAAGAGAGAVVWPKENWLMTSYTTVTEDFDAWSIRHGVSGVDEDPDGDGIGNLVEFGLGLDPQQASTHGLPTLTRESGQFVFRFTRPNNLSGLVYSVRTSSDLADWSEMLTTVIESSTATAETLIATAPQDQPKRFVVLMIQQQ